MTGEDRPNPGRPRSEEAGPRLLAAARTLVRRHGYKAVSIGMIAEEAGVGRQTLYRRWSTKADLVLEAFLETAGDLKAAPDQPVREALSQFLTAVFCSLKTESPAIRNLIASAQEDPQFMESFRARFVVPREKVVTDLLHRAVVKGELPEDLDIEVVSDALHGAFWYRMLTDEPLDAPFAQRLVAALLPD